MKLTLFTTLFAFLACLAICFSSLLVIHRAVDEMNVRCALTERAVKNGDIDEALAQLAHAGRYWNERRGFMEIVVSHTLLLYVSDAQVAAQIALSNDELNEFNCAMAILYSALTEVRDHELPSIANIL